MIAVVASMQDASLLWMLRLTRCVCNRRVQPANTQQYFSLSCSTLAMYSSMACSLDLPARCEA